MADNTESHWYDGIASASKYLIGTGVDVYKSTLDAKTTQKANQAASSIAKAQADDIVTIAGYEVSVTKVLAIVAATMGLLWLTTMSKIAAKRG